MDDLNVKQIIKSSGLDVSHVAEQLFPRNKHADLALRRVIKGEALLNTAQLVKLSALTGAPISELFELEKWKGKSRGTSHTFKSGNYEAEVNMEEGKVSIFHKKSLFHTQILHSKAIPLNELLGVINNQIKKYESKD